MDNRQWLTFEYGPAAWTGTRKQENVVHVLHCWRINGDISKSSQVVTEQRRHSTSHGVRVEEVHVTKDLVRFKPTSMKEKLFTGWTGWSDADFHLHIGDMEVKRGVFAVKAEMSAAYLAHRRTSGSEGLPAKR